MKGASNQRRGEAARGAAQQRAAAVLHAAGHAGMTTPEVLGALGLSSIATVTHRLRDMVTAGLAGEWPDPIGRCSTRKRYWHCDFMPAKCPPPSGRASMDKPRREVRCETIEQRYSVQIPAGYVSALDSSQCRPWASAAAACIGGARG